MAVRENEEDIKATLEAFDRDQGPSEMVEENKRKRKRKKKKKNKQRKEEGEAESSKSASENKKDETGNNLEIDEHETLTYFSCDGSLDSSWYLSASALSLSEDDQSLNDDNNATDADQLSPLDDPRLNEDNNATDANQFSLLDDPNLNDDNNVTPDESESHHSDHNNLEENDATDAKEHSPMDDVANEHNVIPDERGSSKNNTIASSTEVAESHNSDHNNLEENTNCSLSDSAATSVEHNQDHKDADELFTLIKQVVFGTHDDSEGSSEQGHGSSDQSILNNFPSEDDLHRFDSELPQNPPPVQANSPVLQGGSLSHFSRGVVIDPRTPYKTACLRGLMSQQSRRPLAAPPPPIARGRGNHSLPQNQQHRATTDPNLQQPSLDKNANNKHG